MNRHANYLGMAIMFKNWIAMFLIYYGHLNEGDMQIYANIFA